MIKYISAPCGAGKGLWMNSEVQNNKGQKFIIVQETKQLLEQTYKNLNRYKDGQPIKKKIHVSGTGSKNLLLEIIKSIHSDAEVIFITDKMFHQIPVDKLSNHRIFIDDCPASFDIKTSTIVKEERDQWVDLYSKMFKIGEQFKEGYSTFELSDTIKVSDDSRRVMNEYKQFNLYHNKVIATDVFTGNSNVLAVVGWYDYNRYIDLDMTVLMNRFEESLVYKMHPGIFVEETNFKPVDSFNPDNLKRLLVKYFSKGEGRHGLTSSKLRGEEMFKVNQALRDILYNDDYIWATNEKSSLSLPGIRVAVNQRGINTYKDIDKFVFMFACNPTPHAIKHMEILFGITPDDWMVEKELELLNQFGFRTALRKYDDTPVVGYVYDIEQARYFEKMGATIEYIDIGINKRKNPKQSEVPSKERNRFRKWKSNAKGDFSGFEKWADLQIRKGALPEWIEYFRNSL